MTDAQQLIADFIRSLEDEQAASQRDKQSGYQAIGGDKWQEGSDDRLLWAIVRARRHFAEFLDDGPPVPPTA